VPELRAYPRPALTIGSWAINVNISIQLPSVCAIERKLPAAPPIEVLSAIVQEWNRIELAHIVKGKRIAIGIGSRGVAEIPAIARQLAAQVRQGGGEPFIVPAMGSHGGATADGQLEVLRSLGVTEDSAGCPLRATMDTMVIGHTPRGLPIHLDRNVFEADGLIIANRVKPHTDFHGPTESGLLKMLAIGLGKERGAAMLHSYGLLGLREYVPEVAAVILEKIPFLAGFATVEDGYHRPVRLQAFRAGELPDGERQCLALAYQLMPQLPVEDIDVLIVDRLGKDVSGAGMDTNIIGRLRIPGEPEPPSPRIKAIVALDLTEASHGNAIGIGLADFTTQRLVSHIDFKITSVNVFTSGFLERGRLPIVLATDTEAVEAALTHVFRANGQGIATARVMRIADTLALEKLWVSPALLGEVKASDGFISASAPEPLVFAS